MEFIHKPVLFEETINSLDIKKDGIYVDGTAGGAGHSRAIAERLTTGKLYSLDRDPDAIVTATERLKPFSCARVIRGNFKDIEDIDKEYNFGKLDGVLLDIGVSSFQLDNADRGFSFHNDAPLDMRMSKEGTSAEDIVNEMEFNDLLRIIRDYGEEKFAKNIARAIEREREKKRIKTTGELVEIIKSAIPAAARREGGHPARRTFQALRIEVNGELENLKMGIQGAFNLLKDGGRLSIITFHSLEDRIVKNEFKEFEKGCICPPEFPVCVCGRTPRGKMLTRKPIEASEHELDENPRARSAKLRTIIKLHD